MAIGQREIAAIVLEFFVALLLSSEGSFHPIEAFEKLRALVVFCGGFAIVVMLSSVGFNETSVMARPLSS
jgi:hypothetical protein